jgi:acetyl-CoA carboxylase biotin carboxyl carrier protein
LIKAPMIGTFYSSPTPGAPPFVEVGEEVAIGQVIGIIEAMKIMNEIVADRDGVVRELLVANGQPVEYGSPLLRLAAGDAA